MNEALEGLPVAVDLDAAQLDDRLRALLDPAHAAVVAAMRDDVLDGALDDAGGDREVAATEGAVSDLVDPLLEVAPRIVQSLTPPLVAGPRGSDRVPPSLHLVEHALDVVLEERCFLLVNPCLQRGAALLEERAARLPELLEHVVAVDRVGRLGEVLGDEVGVVVVAVGEDVDEATTVRREAALVRFAPSDRERVALGTERRVVPAVQRPFETPAAPTQRVHDDHRDHLAVLRLVPLLAAWLLRMSCSLLAAAMARGAALGAVGALAPTPR